MYNVPYRCIKQAFKETVRGRWSACSDTRKTETVLCQSFVGICCEKRMNIAASSLCLLFDPMNIAIAESFLCQSFAGARIKSCLLFHSMNIAIAESFLCQSFAGARIKSCS